MPEDKRHLGARAHRSAIEKLITNHSDEFSTILSTEREALGLRQQPGATKKPSRLEKLREQLRAAGVEPEV